MKWAPLAFIACFLMPTFVGCQQPLDDFEADPECPTCVARICDAGVDDEGQFLRHVQGLEPAQRAQIIARIESHTGCVDALAWPKDIFDEVYARYGAAFYAPAQGYYVDRARRAIAEIQARSPRQEQAIAYLIEHVEAWKGTAIQKQIERAFDDQLESEAVFRLLATLGSPESIARLSALEPTAERDAVLLKRWPIVDEATRERLLAPYVEAQWAMQSSGSSQYPQYLALSFKLRSLPEGTPPVWASIEVASVRIDNKEVKRGERLAREQLAITALKGVNARHAWVDLKPWLSTPNNYRISTKATLYLWPEGVEAQCLTSAERCSDKIVLEKKDDLDFNYRVFLGVDTGAPRRMRDKEQNAKVSQNMTLSICNAAACQPIWENGKVLKTEKLEVTRGHDFYLRAQVAESPIPIAARLMARYGVGQVWQEVATFYTYAPQHFNPPMRANIELDDLCPNLGKCELVLELRPSLRMARRDPRIKTYWGETLELGTISLDIQNLCPAQLWRSLD